MVGHGPREKNQHTDAIRSAAVRSMEAIRQHPTWSAGAGLECYESALSPEKVNLADSTQTIADKCERFFKYNKEPKPNPDHTMKCFTCCAQRCGQLCEKDHNYEYVKTGTVNLYHSCRKFNTKFRHTLPQLVRFGVPDSAVSDFYFLTKVYGKGEFALLVSVRLSTALEEGGIVALYGDLGDEGEPGGEVYTSHMAFSRLLNLSHDAGLVTTGVEFSIMKMIKTEEERFTVRIDEKQFTNFVSFTEVKRERVAKEKPPVSGGLMFGFKLDPEDRNASKKVAEFDFIYYFKLVDAS